MNSSIFSPIHILMITVLVVIGIVFSYVAYSTYVESHAQFTAPNNSTTGPGWGFIYKTLKAYGWKPCPVIIKHPEALCKDGDMMNESLPVPMRIPQANHTEPYPPPLSSLLNSSSYPMYSQSNQYACPNSTGVLCVGPHLRNQNLYFVPTY